MQIVIYDPQPTKNDYLSDIFFNSLFNYMQDQKRDVVLLRNNIESVKNSKIFIDSASLGNTYPVIDNNLISILKNNNNKVYCFDINDHSSLGFNEVDIDAVDFIYKISGIQNTDTSNELFIDNDCGYRLEPKHYLPIGGINYNNYTKIRDTNRFMSLPYVMNDNDADDGVPYENRIKKCLVRGGAHFKRVHLFFNLLKNNLADNQSAFHIEMYQHHLCNDCNKRNFTFDEYKNIPKFNCTNPAVKWQEELPEDFFNVNRWAWNNRCYPMYYWLAEKFMAKYGEIDTNVVSQVFNNPHIGTADLSKCIGKYMFYGDFKWIFSIYMPQRFWLAARCNCINLISERANDQSYFPEMKAGDHYLTFKEDFSDLDKLHHVTKEQYEHITNNCHKLYNQYIRWDKYKLSTNLMDAIISKIE